MKVKHLIHLLNKVKNKERNIQFLYGNDDEDLFASDVIHVLHALDDDEQGGSTVLKPLGEANWGAVEQNYADYVDKQLEYVKKTVTNKLICKIKGLVAYGNRTDNGFIVYKNSEAVLEDRASSVRSRARREQLIEMGILSDRLVVFGD